MFFCAIAPKSGVCAVEYKAFYSLNLKLSGWKPPLCITGGIER